MELVIARNPDPDSKLPYLVRLPLGEGLLFATKDTWPRTTGLYCHPLSLDHWDESELEEVERVALKACARRGAAIDIIADRARESRTQIVYTQARGRSMVFWQSPRTRKQSRPQVKTPTARAAGLRELEIIVDSREKYPYKFPQQAVSTTRGPLACGDYAIVHGQKPVGVVERKSMADLVSSLSGGRLRYALAELATMPRAAVVVEEPYSKVFAQEWVRPALVADGLAELQISWPSIPIVFCDNRKMAEEWTYRWLSAAYVWAEQERDVVAATTVPDPTRSSTKPVGPAASGVHAVHAVDDPVEVDPPSTRELRAWARMRGMPVPDRGRLRPEILTAWREAQPVS